MFAYHNTVAVSIFYVALSSSTTTAAPLDTFRDCDACPEMIELPLGEFMMGAPLGEGLRGFELQGNEWVQVGPSHPFLNYSEQPIHPVTIDIPFAIGRNEVTYDEWMACVDDGGCNGYVPSSEIRGHMVNGKIGSMQSIGTFPAMRISYFDALIYIDWLNEKVGTISYRLPTEAEWEYAARAGTQSPFAQGLQVSKDQVNSADGDWVRARADDDSTMLVLSPVRVGELDAANAWGLRHMSGNVGELTMSCFTPQQRTWSFSSEYLQDARDRESCSRVSRGGSFAFNAAFARVAVRAPVDEDVRIQFRGFRILRELNSLGS